MSQVHSFPAPPPALGPLVLPSLSLQGTQPQTTTVQQSCRVGLNSSSAAYKLCDPGGGD